MTSLVKCLLVDDLDENLLALSALLRDNDVELLTARSGSEALEFLLIHDVALTLLDVHMPDMDGFELAELIRGFERTRDTPIIFITAGARDQHRLFKGYEKGAVDFLYKPIDAHVLKNKARVFFQLYRQKHQLAQELRERTETLRLNEMFTAVLGHDLRNPLNAIVMMASLLEHSAADVRARDLSTRILSSGRRMSRLIDDVLDLARARLAGGISIKRDRIDLCALTKRVVSEHQVVLAARHIEVEEDGDCTGEWDPDRLTQVVSNLLSNALQHGDVRSSIDIHLNGRARGFVVISVSNDGVISEHVLPHLFDPFRGGQRVPSRSGGLGLGLYIVRKIVEAHHGSIDVESLKSKRVLFRVKLPRSAVQGNVSWVDAEPRKIQQQ